MDQLPVKKVFPSHGEAFGNYHERIEALKRHHRERLEQMKGWTEGNGLTAVDICYQIFGKNMSIHNLRFALSETLAHLEYLRIRGELVCEKVQGTWRYKRV